VGDLGRDRDIPGRPPSARDRRRRRTAVPDRPDADPGRAAHGTGSDTAGAGGAAGMNGLNLQLDGIGTISAPLQIVLLLTLLSFVPAILITMTAFTRTVIVFHFLRQALGTQET